MKHSIKGAVFSGLVFPGLGQVVLGHYKRGIALALTVLLSSLVLVVKALRQAFTIIENIEAEGRVIDMSTISSAAAQSSTDAALFSDYAQVYYYRGPISADQYVVWFEVSVNNFLTMCPKRI